MKEIYDKRFVHFEWDDMLDGKECIVGDSLHDITTLIAGERHCFKVVSKNVNDAGRFPFIDKDGTIYRFCYYDPHLVYKVALAQGKRVEWKYNRHTGKWNTVEGDWDWSDSAIQYRIAEEETTKYITKRQLSRWLAQGNGEFMFAGYHITRGISFVYPLDEENAAVTNEVIVRRWEDTKWHEPTVEYCFPEQ